MPREKSHPAKSDTPPEPWQSFLRELDERLTEAVELHCIGGFVVSLQYGVGRQTSDIDFLNVVPHLPADDLEAIAGLGSELHRKHRLYIQRVTIATSSCPRGTTGCCDSQESLRGRTATVPDWQCGVARQDRAAMARDVLAKSNGLNPLIH